MRLFRLFRHAASSARDVGTTVSVLSSLKPDPIEARLPAEQADEENTHTSAHIQVVQRTLCAYLHSV